MAHQKRDGNMGHAASDRLDRAAVPVPTDIFAVKLTLPSSSDFSSTFHRHYVQHCQKNYPSFKASSSFYCKRDDLVAPTATTWGVLTFVSKNDAVACETWLKETQADPRLHHTDVILLKRHKSGKTALDAAVDREATRLQNMQNGTDGPRTTNELGERQGSSKIVPHVSSNAITSPARNRFGAFNDFRQSPPRGQQQPPPFGAPRPPKAVRRNDGDDAPSAAGAASNLARIQSEGVERGKRRARPISAPAERSRKQQQQQQQQQQVAKPKECDPDLRKTSRAMLLAVFNKHEVDVDKAYLIALVEDIEAAVLAYCGGETLKQYKDKILQLKNNLGFNASLRERLIYEELHPSQLPKMSIDELARPELVAARHRIEQAGLEKVILPGGPGNFDETGHIQRPHGVHSNGLSSVSPIPKTGLSALDSSEDRYLAAGRNIAVLPPKQQPPNVTTFQPERTFKPLGGGIPGFPSPVVPWDAAEPGYRPSSAEGLETVGFVAPQDPRLARNPALHPSPRSPGDHGGGGQLNNGNNHQQQQQQQQEGVGQAYKPLKKPTDVWQSLCEKPWDGVLYSNSRRASVTSRIIPGKLHPWMSKFREQELQLNKKERLGPDSREGNGVLAQWRKSGLKGDRFQWFFFSPKYQDANASGLDTWIEDDYAFSFMINSAGYFVEDHKRELFLGRGWDLYVVNPTQRICEIVKVPLEEQAQARNNKELLVVAVPCYYAAVVPAPQFPVTSEEEYDALRDPKHLRMKAAGPIGLHFLQRGKLLFQSKLNLSMQTSEALAQFPTMYEHGATFELVQMHQREELDEFYTFCMQKKVAIVKFIQPPFLQAFSPNQRPVWWELVGSPPDHLKDLTFRVGLRFTDESHTGPKQLYSMWDFEPVG